MLSTDIFSIIELKIINTQTPYDLIESGDSNCQNIKVETALKKNAKGTVFLGSIMSQHLPIIGNIRAETATE